MGRTSPPGAGPAFSSLPPHDEYRRLLSRADLGFSWNLPRTTTLSWGCGRPVFCGAVEPGAMLLYSVGASRLRGGVAARAPHLTRTCMGPFAEGRVVIAAAFVWLPQHTPSESVCRSSGTERVHPRTTPRRSGLLRRFCGAHPFHKAHVLLRPSLLKQGAPGRIRPLR